MCERDEMVRGKWSGMRRRPLRNRLLFTPHPVRVCDAAKDDEAAQVDN
jgi:hypothetical protein